MNEALKQQVAQINLLESNLDKSAMLNQLVGFIEGYVFDNKTIPTEQQETLAAKIVEIHKNCRRK